jgi:hypothetical protein
MPSVFEGLVELPAWGSLLDRLAIYGPKHLWSA